MSVTPASVLAASLFSFLAAMLGVVAWRRPDRDRLGKMAEGSAWVSLVLVLGLWVARWVEAGHLPLFGTFESSLSIAAATLLVPILFRFLNRIPAPATPAACLVAAAVLFHGRMYDPTPYALTISERSWVVDIHAFVAWAAFGMLAANAGFAAWLILRAGGRPAGSAYPLVGTLTAGFLLHSAMLVSGSVYKFLLFGTAWSFDPIETLGLASWCAYGTVLHMHLFAGWQGRKLAGWCLAVFILLVVSYRGIVLFPTWSTYHIFDMDMRIHLTGSEQYEDGESVD